MSLTNTDPGATFWTADALGRNIEAVIRTRMALTGMRSMVELAAATGISKSTLYGRMDDPAKFDALELARIAEALGFDATEFYRPIAERFRTGSSRTPRPNLRVIEGTSRPELPLGPKPELRSV